MKPLNAAEQIHDFLGIPLSASSKSAHGNKTPKHTKAGPGRYHLQGKKVQAA